VSKKQGGKKKNGTIGPCKKLQKSTKNATKWVPKLSLIHSKIRENSKRQNRYKVGFSEAPCLEGEDLRQKTAGGKKNR